MILSVSRRTGASKRRVCNVLGLPRSSFYTAATESPIQAADRELGSRVERLFSDHLGRCGYRRISAELGDRGVACPPGRTRNLMAQGGCVPSSRGATGRRPVMERPPHPPATCSQTGRCRTEPTPCGPVTSPTSEPPLGGFISRWSSTSVRAGSSAGATPPHMRSTLVCEAMENALKTRKVGRGLIFHSNRGSQ